MSTTNNASEPFFSSIGITMTFSCLGQPQASGSEYGSVVSMSVLILGVFEKCKIVALGIECPQKVEHRINVSLDTGLVCKKI